VTDYTKPPVSPEDMDKIEARHKMTEVVRTKAEWHVPNQTAAHADRGRLIEQLNYTAAVVIDLQLKLADLKDTLKEMRP